MGLGFNLTSLWGKEALLLSPGRKMLSGCVMCSASVSLRHTLRET